MDHLPETQRRLLADFLETDVGPFPDDAARLIAGLEGPDGTFKAAGNIYVMQRADDRVRLSNMHDGDVPALDLSRAEMLAALRRWADAMGRP